MKDVYERLRDRLDDLATGYPATESGIEISILKRLFTEEEAEFFLQLSRLLQTSEDVAKRLDRDPEEVSALMERMAKKGLLFRQRKGELLRYSAVPFVVGIYEFHVNALEPASLRNTMRRRSAAPSSHSKPLLCEPFPSTASSSPLGQ
jgi:electron transport complex protein RnfB